MIELRFSRLESREGGFRIFRMAMKIENSQIQVRRRPMNRTSKSKSGQTMVEYIIIIVIIAIAAIAIFGVFGDTIRAKLGGAVDELGGDSSAKDQALGTTSHDWLKDLGSGSGN